MSILSQQHISERPSEWVQRWTHLIEPHVRVLDLACGHGRHARWFAQRGSQVLAVDRNEQALAHIQNSKCANIQTRCLDLETGTWPLTDEQFDLLLVTHYLWRPIWSDLIACIRPGGWVIYETFSAGNEQFGSPKRSDFLLSSGELLSVFKDFRVVCFEEGVLDSPKRVIQRIVAQKSEISVLQMPSSLLKS